MYMYTQICDELVVLKGLVDNFYFLKIPQNFFSLFVSQEDIEKFRQQVSLKGAAKSEEPEKAPSTLKITEVPEEEEAKLPNGHAKINGDIAHTGPRGVTVGGE